MLNAALPRRRPNGFSLLELILGITLGLLVLASALALYGTTVKSNADNLKAARLNQELRAAMNLLTRDLRRAGYWAAVPGVDDLTANPFQDAAAGSDIAIGAYPGEAPNSCITFTYDLDADKLLDDVEQFGYRLRDGALEARTGGSPFSCAGGTWERITAPDIEVFGLVFAFDPNPPLCLNVTDPANACASGAAGQYLRQIDILLAGRFAADPLVQTTLSVQVRVRNDKFVAAIP